MNKKTKNRFLLVLSVILFLISAIVPNFVKAINVGEDIKFTGYGTVPYHLKAYSLNGGYVSTHLVRIL